MNDNSVSVTGTPNAKTASFSSALPDYKEVLCALFRKWAENALPGEHKRQHLIYLLKTDLPVHLSPVDGAAHHAADQKYMIDLQEDGHPRFPVVDIDLVAPNNARLMLKAYIELTWSEFELS